VGFGETSARGVVARPHAAVRLAVRKREFRSRIFIEMHDFAAGIDSRARIVLRSCLSTARAAEDKNPDHHQTVFSSSHTISLSFCGPVFNSCAVMVDVQHNRYVLVE
jgi:hypothetical protein